MNNVYGLIGKKLGHSFSKKYFTEKFNKEGLENHSYELFELSNIAEFPELLKNHSAIKGLNVTIPYKSEAIPYLTAIDAAADAIGAVNTIKITSNKIIGYNTDAYGFEKSLFENVKMDEIKQALILGSGGASKAVQYVLQLNQIPFYLVSREKSGAALDYNQLMEEPDYLNEANLVVNTTPLGMYPEVDKKPYLPYHQLTKNHILFDLVYNPETTAFLNEGEKRGAQIIYGLQMLHYQADRAWKIWNEPAI